jgi:hypothetical protein
MASAPIDLVRVDFPGGRRGFRLFHRQPTAEPIAAGAAADGRQRWQFTGQFSGVSLFGLYPFGTSGYRDPIPATSIDLPGGYTIDLIEEAMPAEALLSFGYSHWIDKCLSLRISREGVTQAVGYWQHGIPTAGQVRLSAGIYIDEAGIPKVYAHLGRFPVASFNDREQSLETAPSIPDLFTVYNRLASPFGSGVSLTCDAQADDVIGQVEIRNGPSDESYNPYPASAWFLHSAPLEGTPLPLAPTAEAITARPSDGLAWGRQPAAVAIAPVYFRLAEIEAAGHVEWLGYAGAFFAGSPAFYPGASQLFREGRMSPVLPPEWPAGRIRTNIHHSPAVATRLTTLRVSWSRTTTIPFSNSATFATGPRDIGLGSFGAWNEYRPPGWLPAGAATNTSSSGEAMPGTIEGVFLGINLSRVDATNLGGITSQADAVEVTRYVVRWLVASKTRVTNLFDGSQSLSYGTSEGAAILPEADGLALLAGDQITLDGAAFSFAGLYPQGTYPTPTLIDIGGILTLQAVG